MDRKNFIKLIGADNGDSDYIPVAFLLKSSYGGIGYFNASVNEPFTDLCVLLNARLMNLDRAANDGHSTIHDFSELVAEVASAESHDDTVKRQEPTPNSATWRIGDEIPIVAVPLAEFAVVYPVSQIRALMARANKERGGGIPTFFNLDKSELLRLLRIRLW